MFYGIKCQEVQTESEEAPQREPENHTRLLEEGKTAREKTREKIEDGKVFFSHVSRLLLLL